MTFTRAARKEALTRTGKTEKDFPYLKTIHSICYHQLAIGRDQIVRPEDIRSFGNRIGVKLTGVTLDPWIEEFERTVEAPTREDFLIQANHNGRHRKIMLKEAMNYIPQDIDFMYATWFTRAYREWKTANGLLDYTDLLSRYIEYGRPLDIDVIFIDEAQDLSSLQWDTVFKLGERTQRWYIAGDDDQAVFHWAGADSDVFQSLPVDKVEVLHQSYRLSKAVHRLALKLTSRMKKRLEKDYKPTESEGSVEYSGYLQSTDLNQNSFVLFRNHYRGAQIGQYFKDELIPYIGRGSPLTDPEVRITLAAWHNLMKRGEATSAMIRGMLRYADADFIHPYCPAKSKGENPLKIAEVFIEIPKWHHWFRILNGLPAHEAISPYVKKNGFIRTAFPKIELLSIHQSKGREAHTVILDPEMSRATWLGMIKDPDDEHRCWYVGASRAKERVLILLPDGNYFYRL